jgi:hypothetical protein
MAAWLVSHWKFRGSNGGDDFTNRLAGSRRVRFVLHERVASGSRKGLVTAVGEQFLKFILQSLPALLLILESSNDHQEAIAKYYTSHLTEKQI